MKTVYKYSLQPTGYQQVTMPTGSQILTVQLQRYEGSQYVSLWAIVETDNEPEQRRFLIAGTGQEIKHKLIRFLGTVQLKEEKGDPKGKEGANVIVAHVFEVE